MQAFIERLTTTEGERPNPELEHVEQLVAGDQAHTYIFMTSMSVDARAAAELRKRLHARGVTKAHILGKQYLVRAIRSSARFRALVPQVYGLGDLSAILDPRLLQQTRASLDHRIPKLKVYVPTAAHRKAVNALSEHGVVLLLGKPMFVPPVDFCAPRRWHRFNNQRSLDHRVSPSYFRLVCEGIRKMTTYHTQAGGR